MSTIEERVLRMTFDNAAFEQNIARTRDSLGRFTKQLEMTGATKGLSDVDAASKKLSFKGIEEGVSNIAGKFKAMSVVGVTALATVTSRAVSAGLQLAKSFSISPILDGFHEYETNIGSIQTILANTGLEGEKGLNKVNKALNDLNHYSDQTIYNFSEMAKNIGTFTAAGVSLDTSTKAIKGIANLAAVSGSNADQASAAMYQLSQALAAGKVTLEDWNSVVNSGMGGKVFQDALTETARVHGVKIDQMIKEEGGFRNTLQKGWLTSKILTETLSKFTGDLSEQQLKSMGYSKQQIADIIKMGKTAKDAATKVKTFSQLIDTLKEAIGSGWTQTWTTVFGNFTEARTLFTSVSNTLGGFINASSNARNKVLSDWKALGGRTALIQSISNVFHALIAVLKPIKDAFREIFPATTGKQLYNLTVTLRDFTEKLKIGAKTSDELKRTFAGVFAIFGIGIDIIKGVVGVIFDLFGAVTKGSGGLLGFTANVGDFLVGIRNALKQGNALSNFFEKIGKILTTPIRLIQVLAGYLGSLFDGFNVSGAGASKSVEGFAKKLSPLSRLLDGISSGGDKLVSVLKDLQKNFGPLGQKIAEVFGKIKDYITGALSGVDFSKVFAGINTGLLAGLFLVVKNFLSGLGSGEGFGGIAEAITGVFDGMTDTLSSMQSTLKAATLLQIAAAIGILTLSAVALSKIDAEGLTRALSAMTVMFGQLMGSLAVFIKFIGTAGFAKLPFVMGSLILLAAAIDILAIAVKQLAGLSWNDLAKGLTGVTVLLAALVAALKFMPPSSGLVSTGLGLVVLAAAIKILASAVTDLSGLSWQEMAKGLVGVGALLGALTLFTMFSKADKGGVLQGAGIILLAAGIKILASALKDFASFSWTELGKGLAGMAGGLVLIGAALYLIPPTAVLSAAGVLVVATSLGMIGDAVKKMGSLSWGEIGKGLTVMAGALVLIGAALYLVPPTALLSAAGILVVAASLGLISDALKDMASMSWEEIGKSLVVLAGSLGIIAAALIVMTTALPGAAALIVVVASLMLLAPVLETFGQMSWESIGKGLLMLAGVFTVIGLAGVVLTPLVPVLTALGIAITLMGLGALAAGAGVLLFATGLTALSVAGAAGAAALVAIVTAMVGLLPMVAKQIGLAVVAFAQTIGAAGPAITKAIVQVLTALINAINKLVPKIVQTLASLMLMMLKTMLKYVPSMVDTGMKLLTAVFNGIAKNMPKMSSAAANVIAAFINGIANNLSKVIQAGVNLIIKFINGVANAIRSNSAALGRAGANLATAIIEGMARGLTAGLGTIASKAASVARSALNAAKSVLGIHSPSKEFEKIGNYVNDGFRKGLDGNKSQIDTAFNSLKSQLSSAMKDSAKDVDTLTAKLKKLKSARHEDAAAIKKTAAALAQAKKEHAAESAAYSFISKQLTDEHTKLGALATKYDTLTAKITAANDALANAKKVRDDYNTSVTQQFETLPDITDTTTVTDYVASLQDQVEKTKEFANTLARLRKLGLSDDAYKQLVAEGITALPFANQLLAGGKTSIDQINSLDKQLDTAAAALGKSASTALYQAGVDSAQGLVDGLKLQQKALEKQMDILATAMVNSIKKKLGIKSPAKAFIEVGDYSAQGLVKGMSDMSGVVGKASGDLGTTAVDSLSKSLSGFSDLITSNVDINPTITPVLDLSSVKKNAGTIGSMLSVQPISVDSSYAKAKAVSESVMTDSSTGTTATTVPSKSVTFNQYNNSPKALSAAEIYRQSKNQISKAKEALDNP